MKKRITACPRCGGRLEEDFAGRWILDFVDLDGQVQTDENIADLEEDYRFLTCANSHDVMREAQAR